MPSLAERHPGTISTEHDLEAGQMRSRLGPRVLPWVRHALQSDGLKKAVVLMYFSIAIALVITGVELQRGRSFPDTVAGSYQRGRSWSE